MSDPTDTTLENVYDAEISPLMVQIIAIAKRAGIPMYASFKLDDDLACTTNIPASEAQLDDDDFRAWDERYGARAIRAQGETRSPLNLTIRNAQGEITHMETIL